MINFAPEMIEKAKTANSAEELLEMAKENSLEMTLEEATAYWKQLKPAYGELSDDELDNVAGGACHGTENGKTYTVVSAGLKCFNGRYQNCVTRNGMNLEVRRYREDEDGNTDLRMTWACFGSEGCCGWCYHLSFDKSTGYCAKSLKD